MRAAMAPGLGARAGSRSDRKAQHRGAGERAEYIGGDKGAKGEHVGKRKGTHKDASQGDNKETGARKGDKLETTERWLRPILSYDA